MTEVLNCRGLRCPKPVLKVAIKANSMPPGSTLEVHADCPSFSDDIKKWCENSGKVLISCVDNGGYQVATIQF
ncbi:MAG: sulfurtransferase TusA family protein [Spirochaetales bacterium]|nr:sulfurtransferase TusA family protein [Spirochaetales bacterium]